MAKWETCPFSVKVVGGHASGEIGGVEGGGGVRGVGIHYGNAWAVLRLIHLCERFHHLMLLVMPEARQSCMWFPGFVSWSPSLDFYVICTNTAEGAQCVA